MANAITTYDFRKRLARHFMDGTALPKLKYMAFGDGGHNTDGTPITPDPSQTSLKHELLRKELIEIFQEDEFSVTGKGKIAKDELVGVSVSEAGILDEDGNLLGFKNFAPKIKDADEEYEISIQLKF